MKKTFAVIVTCALLLSGCVKYVESSHKPFPKFPTPESVPFASPHGTVSMADSDYFWSVNRIDAPYTQSIEETTLDGVKIAYEPLTISGLTNQTLQNKINKMISDKIIELKKYAEFENLPVYPGFYVAYPEINRKVNALGIWSWVSFSNNNVLSIRFYVSVSIKKATSYEYDFSIVDSLNIDLNSGNELTLSDLFVNGSDYHEKINTLILLKSQSKTDPVEEHMEYWVDSYVYKGGFTGIRGDIKFYLNGEQIILLLNENYTEFTNNFSTTTITLNMADLKDIMAVGQRFTKNGTSLYTNLVYKSRNYLYPIHTDIIRETLNGITVNGGITYDDTLSDFYKALRDSLIAADRETISNLDKTKIPNVYYSFSASPVGPYMNVYSTLYAEVTTDVRTTYKPDGTRITLNDVFTDGYDYENYFKNMIKEEAKTYWETPPVIDLDVEFDKMIPTLVLGVDYRGNCFVSLTTYLFDMSQYPETTYTMKITDDPTKFKIKPWTN